MKWILEKWAFEKLILEAIGVVMLSVAALALLWLLIVPTKVDVHFHVDWSDSWLAHRLAERRETHD